MASLSFEGSDCTRGPFIFIRDAELDMLIDDPAETEEKKNGNMEFPNPSPQLETVLAYLQAVSDQRPDEILSHLTDDAEYHWVTPGFDALGPRVKNKEETRAFFTAVRGTFVKDFKYIIHDYVEMPGKIVLQMSSTGELLSGEGQYENQYMWLFHVEEHPVEGQKPKIKVAKEFFDSLYCARVWGLLKTPAADTAGRSAPNV